MDVGCDPVWKVRQMKRGPGLGFSSHRAIDGCGGLRGGSQGKQQHRQIMDTLAPALEFIPLPLREAAKGLRLQSFGLFLQQIPQFVAYPVDIPNIHK